MSVGACQCGEGGTHSFIQAEQCHVWYYDGGGRDGATILSCAWSLFGRSGVSEGKGMTPWIAGWAESSMEGECLVCESSASEETVDFDCELGQLRREGQRRASKKRETITRAHFSSTSKGEGHCYYCKSSLTNTV